VRADRADCHGRRGSALIEVLVAVVLLTTAGTALVTLLGQTSRSMRTTLESDRLTTRASEELDRFALLDRRALASLAGRSHARGWTVDVESPGQGLFAITIAESDTTGVLLRTTLYRPSPDSVNDTP
jgi:Tfp pilus assembly protein PilV